MAPAAEMKFASEQNPHCRGSTRKPKVAPCAMRSLLSVRSRSEKEIEVIGMEVESGVSHTPMSREELMQGARQRTEAVAKIGAQNGQSGDFLSAWKVASTSSREWTPPRFLEVGRTRATVRRIFLDVREV